MVQRSRLGLVHMSLASWSLLILMHAISCTVVSGRIRVEKTKDD